jgi:alpha-beta hydrolase superfamily lysophospholipase
MQHVESAFTSYDGLSIYHQAWLPESAPKSVVLLVHGLAEHSGRYAYLAGQLNESGHAVRALDHRGHGRSQGKRAYLKSYDEFMRDLVQFREAVERAHPDVPLVVLGHSMGGNLAVGHVLDHQAGVRGLVLSAPALAPGSSLSPAKIKLAMAIAKVAPALRLEGLDAEGISRDRAVVDAYLADPLVYTGKVSAGLAAALLGSMQRFPTRYAELRLPILLQQGTADRLVDSRGTKALEAAAVNAKVTSHYYDGFYHEVYNEPERESAISDLVTWLDSVTVG